MRLALCTLALGTLTAAPRLLEGGDGFQPVFSDPLAIVHEDFPMPPVGKLQKKTSASDDGTFGIAIVTPNTRTFELDGKSVEARELIEIEFLWEWMLEVTANYYAQSDDGSVYCFGEVSHVINPALAGPEYSWLVGGATLPEDPRDTIAAAKPALFLPAHPTVGMTWNQVDLDPRQVETASVIATDAALQLDAMLFEHCLVLHVSTSGTDEHLKFFAPGYGEVYTAAREGVSQIVTFRAEQ